MWTALTLAVLAASPPSPTATEVTPGTTLRLAAGTTVDVPGLFSGTKSERSIWHRFEDQNGLLVFTLDDGSTEAVIAPEATVTGTFVGADPTHVHLRRDGGLTHRIHRGSVARAFVFAGTKRRTTRDALVGGATGAALMLGWYFHMTEPGTDLPPAAGGAALAGGLGGLVGAGVGGLIGAQSETSEWREIPLDALPGRRPAHGASRGAPRVRTDPDWDIVALSDGLGLTLALVRRSPDER